MQVTVRIEGADQALRALRTMEPETAKEVGREIKRAGDTISAYIRGNAPSGPPMRGWRTELPQRPRSGARGWPAWAPIGASVSRRGTSVVVASTGASAAIYESAANGVTMPQGPVFVNILQGHSRIVQSGRKQGRLARKAVKENYAQVLRDVEQACERAVDAVNRRMP